MYKLKILSTLLIGATVINAQGAEIKTFGCGITKSAFLTKLNNAYAKKNNIDVVIPGRGGAGKSIKLVSEQKVVAGSGCRPPLLKVGEKDITATRVAWGAIAFIVNKKNKVSNISTQEAKDILTGKITNWKSVGGDNKIIEVYVRKGKNS